MCHAMEAFVSAKRNPFSDGLAISAMNKLGGALYTACHTPDDGAAREQMLIGSCEAGMAFSNSSVTLIHGMSRPLGAAFHIPHGMYAGGHRTDERMPARPHRWLRALRSALAR